MKIAISKASGSERYENYERWLRRLDPEIDTVDLSVLDTSGSLEALSLCQGLVLSGGEDIHPNRYGKPAEVPRCTTNPARDEREWQYVDIALKRQMPILGICRGMQLLNVIFGGSLIVDIPSSKPDAADHARKNSKDSWHTICLADTSLLARITAIESGTSNSAHHQAVDDIASCLRAAAWASDGICEAIEWAEPADKPFLLAVQWHPERMPVEYPLSTNVGHAFLCAAQSLQSPHPIDHS